MAKFRRTPSPSSTPESPALLFRDLDRNPEIKFLWGHQEKLLDQYASTHLNTAHLAIELPTGAGKTLVGLLIAEYSRRANRASAAYLCPTRQLAAQVKSQADRYGIASSLLIGQQKEYNESDFIRYQRSEAVAITTYSAVFNNYPRIDDASLLICDDAHAAATYVASMWTVRITQADYPHAFQALADVLRPVLPHPLAEAVEAATNGRASPRTLDLVTGIRTHDLVVAIVAALDASLPEKRPPTYAWHNIREHLSACSIYCAGHSFEIRPIVPPLQTHAPFAAARQRLYMSATLGEDGDIERCFGVESIERLAIPEGWDKRGTGRRLILFPGLADDEENHGWDTAKRIIKAAPRSLVLVPSDRDRERVCGDLEDGGFSVIGADAIEDSLGPFCNSTGTVLLVANRYEGIDLPGDTCRVLVLSGLPAGSGLQEQYLLERLNAVSQLRDRIRTRVTQAIGRCTRDESDFSVVLVLGDDVLKWFCTAVNVRGMHPEIQAELEFGIENSKDRSGQDIVELCDAFLLQNEDWKGAESSIREIRGEKKKLADEHSSILSRAAPDEIRFQYRLWNGDYEDAVSIGKSVIERLAGGSALRPYQSFWQHNVAVAAFLWSEVTRDRAFRKIAARLLRDASTTSTGIRWLPEVRAELTTVAEVESGPVLPLQEWHTSLVEVLSEWKLTGGRFSQEMAQIVKWLQSRDSKPFERGLEALGRVLGAQVHRWDDEGAPDGLWVFGEWNSFVFEAKTDAKAHRLSLGYVRQARTHEERVRKDSLITASTPCRTVVVSPYDQVDKAAAMHADDLFHVRQEHLLRLLSRARTALSNLRARCVNGDEDTVDAAQVLYDAEECFMTDVASLLCAERVSDLPQA